MPLAVSSFLMMVAIYILLSWGLYLVYRVGQAYPAVVFTMLIGAYFSAYVVRDLDWPFALAVLAALGLGAFASFLPALRLAMAPALAVAIATIALIFIGQTAIRNMDFLGGAIGFYRIPHVDNLLVIAWVAVVVIGFFIYRLDHSRLGRAMELIFVAPDVASTTGINVHRLRLSLQVVAGMMGALAGCLYASHTGVITIPAIGFSLLLLLFCILFVGGYTNMWGVVIFAPILWSISSFLPEAIIVWQDIIYGSLLIAIVILRPEGLIDKKLLRVVRLRLQARH